MTIQKTNEPRGDYLLRVTLAFLRENPATFEFTTDFGQTTCDGACLADDIENHLGEVILLAQQLK